MAQYFNNFSEEAIGSLTNGGPWTIARTGSGTKSWAVFQDGNKKSLRITQGGTSGQDVVGLDALDNHGADLEMLVKFRVNAAQQVPGSYGITVSNYNTSAQGYSLAFLPASSVKSLILYDDKNAITVNYANYNWSNNQIYWVRYRMEGWVNHFVKVWADGAAEPSGWTFTATYDIGTITGNRYGGIGTYTANHTIDYLQFSAGTGGDTAPSSITTDKTQSGMFRVVSGPPTSASVGGYSGGYGAVAGYGQGYATAFYPTSTINDKAQSGIFRVRKTLDNAQSGQFRVRKTFDQTQSGLFQVRTINPKTQVGQFRVRKELTQNQSGIFRVQIQNTHDQSGLFRIKKTFDQSQNGSFRIASEPSRTQTGQFRVQVTTTRTQTGIFKVAAPADNDQIGRFRVQVVQDKNTYGAFRVQISTNRGQSGQFSVRAITDKSQIGRFRVQTETTKTQTGKFTVRIRNDKTQSGSFVVEYIGTKHQVGVFRIYDRNTLPEAIVTPDIYIPGSGSSGGLEAAQGASGSLTGAYNDGSGDIITALDPDSGSLGITGIDSGTLRANDEFIILLFEDDFIWTSENGERIMIEEYDKNDIMAMISSGDYVAESKENGEIQEVI